MTAVAVGATLYTSHALPPANPRASAYRRIIVRLYCQLCTPGSRNNGSSSSYHKYGYERLSGRDVSRSYLRFGAKRRTRLMMPRPLTATISANKALTRFEVFRRR